MDENRQLPISLKVVAILFILEGIYAVIETIIAYTLGQISINFMVLGLFIGPGLLALRSGWRTCALVFLWFGLIVLLILAVDLFCHSGPLDFTVVRQKIGKVPKEFGIVALVFAFCLIFWEYRVLTCPQVRRLFGVATNCTSILRKWFSSSMYYNYISPLIGIPLLFQATTLG